MGPLDTAPSRYRFVFAIGAMATMRDNVVRRAFTVDVFSRCVPSI